MISENNRDLLLFLQFLHINGLNDPKAITVDEPKLLNIGREWHNHKSIQLSIKQGELKNEPAPTPKKLVDTYKQLLRGNEDCKNTADLANKFYYQRIAEVEELIQKNRAEFRTELDHCRKS